MSKTISNSIIRFSIFAMLVCLLLSCKQQKEKSEGKLISKKNPNVSTKIIGATINGKKQGLWIDYDDSGKILSHYIYVNDSLLGEVIHYWEDGTIASMGSLKNGQREGEWVEYYDYDKDKIAEKGSYSNGNKIGIWEYYIEEGNLDKKIEYLKDGKKKVIQDNHLTPPEPASMKPSPIMDSNNNAVVK